MPDRMFREGWLTSLKVNALDETSENFLFRLGLKADKNGVYHGEPELLRAAVYPLKSSLRVAEVLRRRDACIRAGLLHLWTAAEGRPYVRILKFGQKVPRERARHPLPPGDPDETGQEQLPLPPEAPPVGASLNGEEIKERKGTRAKRAQPHHQKMFPGELMKLIEHARSELHDLKYPGGCAHARELDGDRQKRAEALAKSIAAWKAQLEEVAA